MSKHQLIGPFKQILCMDRMPLKGALNDKDLPIIENGGILIKGHKIEAIDAYDTLVESTKNSAPKIVYITKESVVTPGFIDAHTHICFGGTRAKDYALRNAGKTYLEIAKAGGGIWDTVTQTRKETEVQLQEGIEKRAQQLLANGITTIEVKSGYGLSIPEELKMLSAIKKANTHTTSDLIATCLAAHVLPKDFRGTHKEYLEYMSENLFPILKKEELCNRIDAFIEEEAFSSQITTTYFKKAKAMGFDITVHADQFSTGGSKVAVEVGALSADHLEASTDNEIDLLAQNDTIAIALPGASIGLGCDFTPARKLLDAGACVAIASDWNPGSAPMGDLLTQAAILGTFQKLTNAEVLAGITYRAAAALNLKDRGKLAANYLADFSVFAVDNYQEILYQQGQIKPVQIWKNGQLVISN